MSHRFKALLIVLCATSIAGSAPPPKGRADSDDSAKLADRLLERMSLDRMVDQVPMIDFMKLLAEQHDLPIIVDRRAFRSMEGAAQLVAADGAPILGCDQPITIDRVKNMRIETVLRLATDQVDADYMIMPDHIRIVPAIVKGRAIGSTTGRQLPELVPSPNGNDTVAPESPEAIRLAASVTAAYKERKLAEIARDLSSRSGRSIHLSDGARSKANNTIDIDFANVPLESACASLAEACGLRAVRNGNAILLVTVERFQQIERAQSPGFGQTCLGGPIGPFGVDVYGIEHLTQLAKLFTEIKAGKIEPVDPEGIRRELRRVSAELERLEAENRELREKLKPMPMPMPK